MRRRKTSPSEPTKATRSGTRRSDRTTKTYANMAEVDIDDIYRSDSESGVRSVVRPRITATKEVFRMFAANDPFRRRHMEVCAMCSQTAQGATPLINCQGCTLAYHKVCLGTRQGRDHIATKIDEDEFVLQCRRCIGMAQQKDHLAPHTGRCQACQVVGDSCIAFAPRKTAQQEQRDRENNGGEDPVVAIDAKRINNVQNVLFRCTHCWRATHFHHLPMLDQYTIDSEHASEAEIAGDRFLAYKTDWKCKECKDAPAEVGGLVAWRPTESEVMSTDGVHLPFDMVAEEDKEYLVKWKDLSYAHSTFMPGPWVWGITTAAMRIAFAKKQLSPQMRIEDAIPEEYVRIDIVLAVEYSNKINFRTIEVDKARAKEVSRAYIKYKGLGYEDAVWEVPPSPDEGDRWVDFVTAYNDWVAGQWLILPRSHLKPRIDKIRGYEFAKLERKKQPEDLTGGEMMKYQLDGLNWIYYQWHQVKNGILADEMGLGKTIQIIAFLAMMVRDKDINCAPFLVVVPNATCPNWRREIKKWAPSLRVVAFYGTSTARGIAKNYELYPSLPEDKESKDIKAHVVITSYEAAADPDERKFFKSVPWQGLIVDEGQRLKSDKTILYSALKALKIPFRLLLTGTPLQNNARELFNLLQFLDDSFDAEDLEREYTDMTESNIRRLHDLIRPYILRRTKAQVLTFLPPMAQIILPVSMSVVQKKTYTSILAKNPELLQALFKRKPGELASKERASLSNILMQLRKCLCHPYIYNRDIEETNLASTTLHRNLIDASAKLQLLDVLLPKLKEGGHRVLIFSQFLDMLTILEDFLDGLGLRCNRLDGNCDSLEKQKRIDQFNQPDSELFAFLLSTRAGGVGINLATADTVIILDPDFNPHQDIQALSRAHRIGQTKKVLCFQLMTRHSAEEKIMQIGRKKMALDHVVVDQLDADDVEERDLEGILRHGAAELFSDSDEQALIRYDEASVSKLLDRTQIENTKTGGDDSAESQFSFARVWANESGALEETLNTTPEQAPDPSVWDKILKERERAVAAEAAARQQALGRGKRARGVVDYNADGQPVEGTGEDEAAATQAQGHDIFPSKTKRARRNYDDSDTDFQPDDKAQSADEDDEMDADAAEVDGTGSRPPVSAAPAAPQPTQVKEGSWAHRVHHSQKARSNATKSFKRANPQPARVPTMPNDNTLHSGSGPNMLHPQLPPVVSCQACGKQHHQGSCPLKVAGVEFCNLCGLAHYGIARTCPHIGSETQVVAMLEALKRSNEPAHLREAAMKYLKGVKGSLGQYKRIVKERAAQRLQKDRHNGSLGQNGTPPTWHNTDSASFPHLQKEDVEIRLRAALGNGAP